MAEKAEKKPEEKPAAPSPAAPAPEHAKPSGPAGLLKSTPVILGVVMVLEAAMLFAAFRFMGAGAKVAAGAEFTPGEANSATTHEGGGSGPDGKGGAKGKAKKRVEISVLNFKAPNSLRGRTYLYDVSVYVAIPADRKEEIEKSLKEREATIQDRIRTIIAQCDPEKLGGGSEPGLETLRRQVKVQLDEILGDGLIEEVLVPKCIPYRADF